MIPIETIKELVIKCGFNTRVEFVDGYGYLLNHDDLQAFANAIEAMTIDRCADVADDLLNTNTDGTIRDGVKQVRIYSGFSKAIRALKDKD